MKKLVIIFLIMLNSPHAIITGCPTCVGRNQTQSPPFFSEEFYPPEQDGMEELYEKFIEHASPDTVSTSTATQDSTQKTDSKEAS